MKLSIGFVGFGNIASAILNGMLTSKNFSADEVGVFDINDAKPNEYRNKYGIRVFTSAEELVENCNAVLFAVKPNDLPSILKKLNPVICEQKPLIISVAAGKEIKSIEENFTDNQRIVRVMPNINARVSQAISGICGNSAATEEDICFVEKVFNAAGKTVRISEDLFSIFCASAGSAPAFVYMYVDAIARAAVKNGAYKIPALEMSSGLMTKYACELFENEEELQKNIEEYLKDNTVNSELKNVGFYKAINEAITQTKNKDIKMKLK